MGWCSFDSGKLNDGGEDNVGEEESLVDTVSGLLDVSIGFFSLLNTVSIFVMSSRSIFKLVAMRDEGYVYL